ncbi:hypothetical protein TNCV_1354781 [Trichonephila clavipes]|uniref:Uncharacterized protein n=1 Tax=Trichonephila clavipes TaxID=2585209 RepID=A0A8X6SGL8_TRICX|nr:hypothetical protein TNCV_1354781 [Trichonephila clavipes]
MLEPNIPEINQKIRTKAPGKPIGRGSDIVESTEEGVTLADGILLRGLFNAWKEEQDTRGKRNVVLSLVRTTTDSDKYEDQQ